MTDPRDTNQQAKAEDNMWAMESCFDDLILNCGTAIFHPDIQHRLASLAMRMKNLASKRAA